jgi:hypothetical protein
VRTVSSPSYTIPSLSQASMWALPLPGVGCSYLHNHAAIRYWSGHCLPLFDCASVCFTLPAAQVNQMATRLPCRPCPCPRPINRCCKRCRPSSLAAWPSTSQPQPSDLAQPCNAHRPIWGTSASASSWSLPQLIKPATNTDTDCVRPLWLFMASFLLVAACSAAYIRST